MLKFYGSHDRNFKNCFIVRKFLLAQTFFRHFKLFWAPLTHYTVRQKNRTMAITSVVINAKIKNIYIKFKFLQSSLYLYVIYFVISGQLNFKIKSSFKKFNSNSIILFHRLFPRVKNGKKTIATNFEVKYKLLKN